MNAFLTAWYRPCHWGYTEDEGGDGPCLWPWWRTESGKGAVTKHSVGVREVQSAVGGLPAGATEARHVGRHQTLEGKAGSLIYPKMGEKVLSDRMTVADVPVLKKTWLW